MSKQELTKVISIRVPAIYFRRVGFIAYHTGKLPSQVARDILMEYLDWGCAVCGGPIKALEMVSSCIATCMNPDCFGRPDGGDLEYTNCIDDYSSYPRKTQLPGFAG